MIQWGFFITMKVKETDVGATPTSQGGRVAPTGNLLFFGVMLSAFMIAVSKDCYSCPEKFFLSPLFLP